MQTITVDMTPGFRQPTIHYSQNDVGTTFAIDLRSRFGDTLPASPTVKIQATKPSGFGFSIEADSVVGSVATFTTVDTMTDEAGRFQAELQIIKDAVVIYTANFYMEGEANPHPIGTTDGSQETIIPTLTLLVERVEAAAASVLDMTVEAETLAAGSQATYSYDEDTNTATFGIPQGEAGAGAAGVTASAYSSSKTYAVGDYVIHNSNLYRCTTAITTAESFTAAHWTQVVLGDDVADLKSDFNEINDYFDIETGINRFDVDRIITNHYLNNGRVDPLSDWNISNYIRVDDVESVFCSGTYNGARSGCTMYFLTTYDKYKNYIATKPNVTTYTVEAGVKYIRFCYHPSLWSDIMVEEGTVASAYAPYELKSVTLTPSDYNNPVNVNDFEDTLKGSFSPIWADITLSFPNTNKFVTYQGVAADYNNAKYSSNISCGDFEGRKIIFTGSAWSGIPSIVFFDSTDTVVGTFPDSAPASATNYTNEQIAFPDSADYFIVNNLTGLGVFLTPTVKEISKYTTGGWSDVKWVVLGDSLTEVNQRTTMHYFDYIAEKTNINVYNMGVSGTGYARGAESNNAFYQRISAVPNDADVVTIFGSFNDLSAGLDLGTASDVNTTTLAGCINTTINNLLAVLPLANFGIVTPCPWSWTNPSSPTSAASLYCDMIVQICKNRSIPCLDLFHNSLLRPWDATFRTLAYSKDEGNGVHPDENGHKLIAPRFKGFLDTLII